MASILILEDDVLSTTDWSSALAGWGFEAVHVATATEALSMLAERRFDVVIADLFIEHNGRLITDGGLSLISKIRGSVGLQDPEWCTNVPIIAVTPTSGVNGEFDPTQTAYNLGANLVLCKPFLAKELVDLLHRLLNAA